MSRNPYRWDRVDTELFYGRKDVLAEFREGLLNGSSFALLGGLRMGKTTFLRVLEHVLARDEALQRGIAPFPVYIDMNSLDSFSPESMRAHIVRAFSPMKDVRIEERELGEALCQIIKSFRDSRPQLVFLFDEMEPLLSSDYRHQFLANWRHILHNEPRVSPYTSAVFAGCGDLQVLKRDIGSPLANILSWRELPLLDVSETSALVREPSAQDFDDDFVQRVHSETGGHPFLIQFIMQYVMDRMPGDPRDLCTQAVKLFADRHKDQFQSWWNSFDRNARRLYDLMARTNGEVDATNAAEYLGVPRSKVARCVELLCVTGVAAMSGARAKAAGEMFRRWFEVWGADDVEGDRVHEVDRLLVSVEKRMRQLIASGLASKYGSTWLEHIGSTNKTMVEKWKEIAGKAGKDSASEEHLIEYSQLGDLFEVVLMEWETFGPVLAFGGHPKGKKMLLQERQSVLCRARHAIRHARADDLGEDELRKAYAFCVELLGFFEQVGKRQDQS